MLRNNHFANNVEIKYSRTHLVLAPAIYYHFATKLSSERVCFGWGINDQITFWLHN